MRAAAILGLGTSPRDLRRFQENSQADWNLGLPAKPEDADAVLVFGGDGTLHRNLNALVRLGLPVLVVPAGSGNDFARALGLHKLRDSLLAWRSFERGNRQLRSIDLGSILPLGTEVPPHYFACVGGVGLDGDIARRANGLPRWLRRTGGYVFSLPPALFAFEAFPMKLWFAEKAIADQSAPSLVAQSARTAASATQELSLRDYRHTVLVAFANAPFYGGGMRIAPEAKLDDGLFDVCFVPGMNKFKLACLFPTVYSGRHVGIQDVEYFHAARAVIETEYPFPVYADGEPVCNTPAEFRVARAALQVIVKPE